MLKSGNGWKQLTAGPRLGDRNPRRLTIVHRNQKGVDRWWANPFALLVEPTGIEPVTSTMPLSWIVFRSGWMGYDRVR